MRAVNLLPADLRGSAPKPARSARKEPVEGVGAYIVLGVLALAVAALAGFVLTTNSIKQREADLDAAKQRVQVAQAKAAELKPYADFEALANARVETVRGLAAARFDWERALRDLSLAVPKDVKLQSLNGDMGLPGATGSSGGDPLRGSISAPAITLTGCAPTQTGVAQMMAHVKAVQGVTRVALSRSEKNADGAAAGGEVSPCGKGNPPTFSLVVFFERAAAIDALAASTGGTTSSVPVPNVVAESAGSGGAAAGGEVVEGAPPATDATAATDPAAATSTTTSTTTGSTP